MTKCKAKMDKLITNDRVEYHKSYIIAQNWVTELYGILCNNDYSNSGKNCRKLDEQIRKLSDDDKIRDNCRTSSAPLTKDAHLDFLLSKHSCKVIIRTYI